MFNFDSYNALLAIATNICVRLKTDFVVQGNIFALAVNQSTTKLNCNCSFNTCMR